MHNDLLKMSFSKLNILLDSLLEKEGLPTNIGSRNNTINYKRKESLLIRFKTLYLFGKARLDWNKYIIRKITDLKKDRKKYKALYESGCFKDLKVNIYLARIILAEICKNFNQKYNAELFANFAFSTLLYDASFDVPECRDYIKDFNMHIINESPLNTKDNYLMMFKESEELIIKNLNEIEYHKFLKYIRILHIIHLMGRSKFSKIKTDKDVLLKLSCAKGGISLISLLILMPIRLDENELKIIYDFGASIQLIDDIFDIEKDLEIGIKTIPNQKLLSFNEIKELYYGSVNNLINVMEIKSNKPNVMLEMLCLLSDKIENK